MTIKLEKEKIPVALKYGYVNSALSNTQWNEIIDYCSVSKPYSKQVLEDLVCSYISKHTKAPLVTLFSGGVDSTFMLCMARRCFSEKDISTVTVEFKEKEFDESFKAISVLNGLKFGGKRKIVPVLHPVKVLDRFNYRNYNNLFFSSSIVPTYTAMQEACNSTASILTGDGGDELFGGYDRYLWWDFKTKHKYISKIISYFKADTTNIRGTKWLVDRYEDLCSIWLEDELKELLNVQEGLGIENSNISVRYNFVVRSDMNMYKRMMFMDIGTELYGVEKYKVDQAFAMAGKEGQNIVSPFMDLNILNHCMSLPVNTKISGGKRKVALRNSIKDRYKDYDTVSGNRKKGFGAPVNVWLSMLDNSSNYRLSILNKEGGDLFNTGILTSMTYDHFTGKADYGEKLWAVTNLLYLIKKGIIEIA